MLILRLYLKLFFIVVTVLILSSPGNIHAADLETQKKVISGYRFDSTNQYPAVYSSDCSKKEAGDANCDGVVDLVDLSLWEIEFKTGKSTRWSDFNRDGKVTLIDFKIWKDSQNRPNKPVSFVQSIAQRVENLIGLTADFLRINVLAQSTGQNNPATVSNSFPITYSDGSSIVVNAVGRGQQYIELDPEGNLLQSRNISQEGATLSRSLISESGEVISFSSQEGVNIQTVKKDQGPLIQFFGDDNNPLVVKSWPNAESAERGDPPVAVSIPLMDWGELAMVVNPNGTSVISHTGPSGETLSETQVRTDGTHISRNHRNNTVVESNDKLGASFARVPNSLGGYSSYYFYREALYAVVQTDKDGNYHIAKPLDNTGLNWKQVSTVNGQTIEKNVTDPVADLNSGVPSPGRLVDRINNFKSAISEINRINFSDAFGETSLVPEDQLTSANRILNIQSVRPQVIGFNLTGPGKEFNLIKEAKAEEGDNDFEDLEADVASQIASSGSIDKSKVGDEENDSKVVVNGKTQTSQVVNRTTNTTVVNQTNSLDNTGGWSANGAQINAAHSQVQTQSRAYQYYYTATSPGTPTGTTSTPVDEGPKGTCFLAGTMISTPDGYLHIENLKPGNKVYSFNEKTGRKEISDFAKLDINFVDDYLIINNRIKSTTYHPFYVFDAEMKNSRLVKAGDLKAGDLLLDESGNLLPVVEIQKVIAKTTVYNLLAVTPNDNFFAEGILVHNYNNNDAYTNSHSQQQDNQNNNDQSSINDVSMN